MNRPFAITLILLASAISAPGSTDAEEWSIPMGGNVFRTAPTPGGRAIRRDGALVFRDSEAVFSTYFHIDRPAALELSVNSNSDGGQPVLITRVGDQTFRTNLKQGPASNQPIGRVEIRTAGYVKVDFQVEDASTDIRIDELVVSSGTGKLQLDYVKTNQGNMFYWGRRGPSVHLRYGVPKQVDLRYAYCEITVPPGQDPIGSYFMANGFGEGYFGIQVNSETERRILFSVWSPFKTDNPRDIPKEQRIIALAKGPGVHIGEFGNEGSGGQSYLVYPWTAGTKYRFLTEVRPDGNGNTVYSSWFGEAPTETNRGSWRRIASFKRPKTDTHLRGFHSFLENFAPTTGHIGRRVSYTNVWVRDTTGKWHECNEARFSVDATGGGRHRLDFAGGVDGDAFYLRNCGFFNETGRPGESFTREPGGKSDPGVDFENLP